MAPRAEQQAGYPVRRGPSIPSLASLEYWVARSSRAMTALGAALSRIQLSNSQTHSFVGRRFRDGALAPDLRCAIAHRGTSRFRVRCGACHLAALCADPLASLRNDGLKPLALTMTIPLFDDRPLHLHFDQPRPFFGNSFRQRFDKFVGSGDRAARNA